MNYFKSVFIKCKEDSIPGPEFAEQKTLISIIGELKRASTSEILTKFPDLSKRTLIRELNYLKSLALINSAGKSVSLVWIILNNHEE